MLEILVRGLDQAAPSPRTPQDNHATLLISWWCTGFALVIILLRVCGRFIRSECLFTEDKIMFWSIVPLLARMACAHIVMLYGTNNVNPVSLSAMSIHSREIGSKAVLASRILYALYIWTAKWSSSQFLKRLTYASWSPVFERILRAIRVFLVVTFIGVVIGTLAECQPFDHYWQVSPDPGAKCRNGYAQLFTMGISDIITDIFLILFPIPIIMRSTMTMQRKIGLSLLFMLSIFLIAITTVRIITIVAADALQQRRTLWASIEILAAAAVSNALILGSFVRDRGTKKSRFKATPTDRMESEGPSINRQMTLQHWGGDSDEDLFRSLGSRLNSIGEVRSIEQSLPRSPVTSAVAKRTARLEPIDSEDAHADTGDEARPEAYAAFLQQTQPSSASLQKNGPSRGLRSSTPPRLRSPDLVTSQDFGNVDWSGSSAPENLQLGDAGGLLPTPTSPRSPKPIIQRHPDVAELSPTASRQSAFSSVRGQRAYEGHRSTELAALIADEAPRPSQRTSSAHRRSASQTRPGTRPDDLQLGDAGGLLT